MMQQDRFSSRVALAAKILRETPTVRLDHPADDAVVKLYAKIEFCNGIGSIKDRPALWVLQRAIERGEIGPESTVIESSSGNFARALSVFCSIIGLKFVPVIDPNISPFYEAILSCSCDTIFKVTDRDETGGFLKTRLRQVQELVATTKNSYWPNQYENTDCVAAHYHTTGAEIARLQPDYVFIGVSTGGTIAGVSQRLKESQPNVRVVAVDVEGSVIFGGAPKKRTLPGLGSSIRPPLLNQARIDDVVIVPESAAVSACHRLLERYGLFVGASTGSVYSAIEQYFPKTSGARRPRVLFLCCDRGSAYLHNVFEPGKAAHKQAMVA
ncbi:2,3-diaminopropionate biosynthesis protein SbnA [Bradyrhizobium sp.]